MIRPDAFSYPLVSEPRFNLLVASSSEQRFTYRLTVKVPRGYIAATLGELVYKKQENNHIVFVFKEIIKYWRIDLSISHFKILIDRMNNIMTYVFPEDIDHGRRIIREIICVLKLYINLLGNPPVWKGYRVIEIPEGWGGQACMARALLRANSIRNPAKISIIYHEMAHL